MGSSVDYKRQTGVYSIEVPEIKHVYIGQSVNVPNRIRQHKSVLRHGKSKNKQLQADFDSGKTFVFRLLEECYNKDLLRKETEITRQYIKDGWYVYNVCIVSDTNIANIPVIHKEFIMDLIRVIDTGRVTKEQITALYKI